MSTICLRHELAMLRLGLAGLRGGDRGFHSPEHARLLKQVEACPRCRRRRSPTVTVTATITATCPEDVGPTTYKAVLEDAVHEAVSAKVPAEDAIVEVG